MKNFRLFFATILVALVLSVPAYAGDMSGPSDPTPPPPAPGDMHGPIAPILAPGAPTPVPGDTDTPTETILRNLLIQLLAVF